MDHLRIASPRRVEPTVEAIVREFARGDSGLEPWSAGAVRALSPSQRRGCAALLEQRRGRLAEELCVVAALRGAEAELQRLMEGEWLSCVQGVLLEPEVRRRIEVAQFEVERIERSLVIVRTALAGIAEDVRDLLRRGAAVRDASNRGASARASA